MKNSLLNFFWHQFPKSSRCGLFEAGHPKTYQECFCTPKRYDWHPCPVYMVAYVNNYKHREGNDTENFRPTAEYQKSAKKDSAQLSSNEYKDYILEIYSNHSNILIHF